MRRYILTYLVPGDREECYDYFEKRWYMVMRALDIVRDGGSVLSFEIVNGHSTTADTTAEKWFNESLIVRIRYHR